MIKIPTPTSLRRDAETGVTEADRTRIVEAVRYYWRDELPVLILCRVLSSPDGAIRLLLSESGWLANIVPSTAQGGDFWQIEPLTTQQD